MSHHHPHHNYPNHPNHGRPHRLSPTSGDSHSGSLYSEGRTVLPPLTIAFPTSDSPVPTNVPNTHAQRSSPMPYGQNYYPPAQQQQTFVPDPTYPSFQQLSDTRYHSGQTHGSSYNRTSPFSGSADPRYPPPLDVPDGRWQGQQYYTPHSDLQIPPSSDLRSPHSVYSPASSSFPQYQSAASSGYPAGHSPSRGAVHTPAATHAHYQPPMAMSHTPYLDRTNPSSRNTTQLPYARVPTAPSPVPFDVPPEASEPTIKKKRKRADARQLEALNRMYARTAFPSTEERQQLARDLDMSARSVQIWFQNKRQASRQGGRNPPSNPSIGQVAGALPPDTPAVVMHPRGSSPPVSPMGEVSYRSRSPMAATMRTGQTPSPPSGRPRADIDPRTGRYWGR